MLPTLATAYNTNQLHHYLNYGAANATEQAAMSIFEQNGQTVANSTRMQVTDRVISTATTAVIAQAELASLDPDGFTLNWTDEDAAVRKNIFLAGKGGGLKVASILQPTSAGAQALSGWGLEPKGVLAFSVCAAVSAAVQNEGRYNFGVASSPTERQTFWAGAVGQRGDDERQLEPRERQLPSLHGARQRHTDS